MDWTPPRNHIQCHPRRPHCYSLPSPLSERAASQGDRSHTPGSASDHSSTSNGTIINAPDEDTYCIVRGTTLSLAESVERLGFVTHRAGEFLVLGLGTFSALDRTMVQIVAQLKMMPQIHDLFVRIGCRRLDSLANGATYPKQNKLGLKSWVVLEFDAYLSGSCCCFNL